MQAAAELMKNEGESNLNEDRAFSLPTLIYEMPTDLGMPVAYDVQATLLGSLRATLDPDDEEHEDKKLP